MFFIESERLKMTPLTHAQLLLLREDREKLELSMGLNPSNMLMEQLYIDELIDALDNFWLPKIREFPHQYEWYTTWEIILKTHNVSVGGMGFAGYPNQDGEAMIGYCIDQKQHGKGYGTEALNLLSEWAFTCPDLKTLVAETAESNLPSRRLLQKAGFTQTGTRDEFVVFKLSGK
jgi:ribosomal-protein-alanine N-acetyltransferase